MAKFLTAKACAAKIEETARQAGEKIWLISPYIDIDEQLKQRLRDRDRAGIEMRLVYRGKKLPEDEREWLNSFDSLEIRRLANLHAKCYMNENEALITSLNLYEYSQNHNVEWGILISRRDDEELYQEIFKEAVHILRLSDVEKESVKRPQPTTGQTPGSAPETRTRTGQSQPALPETGVCIRWGEPIEFDMLNLYCGKRFSVWNRFKKRECKENKCHACGQDWMADIDRPLCLDCRQRCGGILVKRGHGRRRPENCVCIRCGDSIGFDLSQPYCGKRFRIWNMYTNLSLLYSRFPQPSAAD